MNRMDQRAAPKDTKDARIATMETRAITRGTSVDPAQQQTVNLRENFCNMQPMRIPRPKFTGMEFVKTTGRLGYYTSIRRKDKLAHIPLNYINYTPKENDIEEEPDHHHQQRTSLRRNRSSSVPSSVPRPTSIRPDKRMI